MIDLKKRKAYYLSELITIIANAIIENGIDKLLDYKDMDFCIYTKGYTECASANLVCYLEDYPNVNDEDEEEYPEFVCKEKLKMFYHAEHFEDVISNALYQKRNASMDEFIAGLNYYREHDDFITM